MQYLNPIVREQSACIVTLSFTDEDGVAKTPDSIVWSLTDMAGTVINSRSDVSVVPATTVSILLNGNDLVITGGGSLEERILTVEAEYTSATFGSGIKIKKAFRFVIENLTKVT